MRSKIIDIINEWERDDDAPAQMSAGEAKKKEQFEEYKARRAEEAAAVEAADVAAKEAAFEEKERIAKALVSASALAAWPEVKEALSDLKHELTIDRVGMPVHALQWARTHVRSQSRILRLVAPTSIVPPPRVGPLLSAPAYHFSCRVPPLDNSMRTHQQLLLTLRCGAAPRSTS